MKHVLCFLLIFLFDQHDVEITHHRRDLVGKTLIGNYNFSVSRLNHEDNIDMIHRGYDSAKTKARELNGSMVYINGRRWRYLGRKLVVITEIYKD